jgi:AraC-like DNA-binding protein
MSIKQKAIIYQSPAHSLYLGKLERQFKKNNITPTLLMSLEGDLELLDNHGNPIARSKSFLIPSGSDISIDTHNATIAMCFLDDLGRNFDSLAPKMNKRLQQKTQSIYFDCKINDEILEHATYIESKRPSHNEVSDILNIWLNKNADKHRHLYDERVAKAVSLIKDYPHLNMSVAEIADKVSLSIPRLIQLFKQVTGTPIRRFRLWQRVFVTAEKLSTGMSLTDAAIAAGFSDYAHFARTYRELSGGNASAARDNTEIRVLAG